MVSSAIAAPPGAIIANQATLEYQDIAGQPAFVVSNFFEIDNGGAVSQCTAAVDADDCEEVAGIITIGGAGTISLAANTTLTLTYQVQILDPATTP